MAQERDDIVGVGSENAPDTDPVQTEKIRDEIERTRANMGETIDAIQERLSISNISEQVTEQVNHAVESAKEAVYDATVGKALIIMKNIGNELSSSSVVRSAKNNPIPFVLIGLGAGILAYQTYNGGAKSGDSNRRPGRNRRHELGDGQNQQAAGALSGARDAVTGAVDSVTGAAGTAVDSVTGAVGSVYSGAEKAASAVYSKAGGLGTAAVETYDTYIEENPLAVGAVALALGAAVGFAIPATRYEGELMGPVREELMGKAQSTATDLIDRAKETLSTAAGA